MNAGKFNEQISVMELQNAGIVYGWAEKSATWAKVDRLEKTNLFSQVGIGAKSVKFTVRKQDLTLHNAFRWQDDHYFLTDINEIDRMYYEITAARIEPKTCVVTRTGTSKNELNRPVDTKQVVLTFPGCLVEKYMGYSQQKPQAVSEMQYVLVTPKAITLDLADLIEINSVTYNLQIAHMLDSYKNEYEIVIKRDA